MLEAAVVEGEGFQPQATNAEGEPRQRRSRDRYGRDRRERGERPARDAQPAFDAAEPAEGDAPVQVSEQADAEPARRSYFSANTGEAAAPAPVAAAPVAPAPVAAAPVAPVAPVAPAPVAAAPVAPVEAAPVAVAAAPVAAPVAVVPVAVVAAPVAAPQAAAPVAAAGLPQIASFTLPLDTLHGIARESGLEWVNSDAEKIAAVQAAIAAEPVPVRVPRERPAPVVIDEGPLVLVETRRDLRDMTLPFEQSSNA
ncbi:hypothetical protein [Acidovorax sp. CCYZU-2555]|uniref:hypothetical protein n=1 Tax=Acidovorax sp. CCYZU-2555 TaxID=2835042 RepID=UPI001BCEA577|nr:hypothetical protein [Acidovorax sp. CCYZU-2555]MBS7777108.1 hypothetical protein [Acidovorax sp. CCYZU-2555]